MDRRVVEAKEIIHTVEVLLNELFLHNHNLIEYLTMKIDEADNAYKHFGDEYYQGSANAYRDCLARVRGVQEHEDTAG